MAYRQTPETKERMAQRRRDIIHAARVLLIERGLSAVTMQEVASSARTSVGNLYFHFNDRNAILGAVADDIVLEIAVRADRAELAVAEGPSRIAAAAYAGVLAVFEHRLTCQRILAEDGTDALKRRVIERFVSRFLERLKRDKSLARGQDLELSALATQGAMFQVLSDALLSRTRNNPRKLARYLAALNLRVLGYSECEIEACLEEVERALKTRPRALPVEVRR